MLTRLAGLMPLKRSLAYEPPVNLAGLAKSFNAGVHHSSAIHFKANVLASTLIPSKYLSRDALNVWPWTS